MKQEAFSKKISSELAASAGSYYRIGIDAFFKSRKNTWSDFQPAIGNLAISVELLLKSIVAKRAISMLYVGLPDELNLFLSHPEASSATFNFDRYASDLAEFHFKAIEFDKAISLFYLISPEGKERFRKFLSNLSKLRNQSVHGTISDIRKYELDRLAYLSANLFLYVNETKLLDHFYFAADKNTSNFLKSYTDDQIAKVKKNVEAAQNRVKKENIERESLWDDEWDFLVLQCPVCGGDGICEGETQHEFDEGELRLTFYADNFSCNSCGLVLDDYDELVLAGMETFYERDSDSDKEKWLLENDGDPSHPYY